MGYQGVETQDLANSPAPGLSRLWALMVLVLAAVRVAQGAPVDGRLFELRQPDGAGVEVRIWGDEFYQVVESLDGYTLIRDPATGVICYAALSFDQRELVSTGVRVGASRAHLDIVPHIRVPSETAREAIRLARESFADQMPALPAGVEHLTVSPSGGVVGICLIIDFPDELGTVDPNEVARFCNETDYDGGGNNGSVYDYYYDVSDGHLEFTNYVPSVYYTAVHDKSYYDNPNEQTGPKSQELVLEALNALEADGFDFSGYDANHDGLIDAVTCLYVGTTQSGWGKGLWPHVGAFSFEADGVAANRYHISFMGSGLELGTFCHEVGHLLFSWPDLYDTDYDSRGVGRFCLMGYGCLGSNPVEPCAFLKHSVGWTNTTLLAGRQEGLSAVAGYNAIYKYDRPGFANEYFLIENRYQADRDSALPDSGLAVWHIDTHGWNNQQEMTQFSHYLVTLVQADGRWDLEHNVNLGDADDLWGSPDFTICGPYLTPPSPNTSWWDGTASGFGFMDVSAPSTVMTFTYGLDALAISPAEGISIVGPSGGPFSPPSASFTISNTTADVVGYVVSKSAAVDWFDFVCPVSGTLGAYGTAEITIGANNSTGQLPNGFYADTISVVNVDSGIEQAFKVSLTVRDAVTAILETDFSEGLPPGWTIVDGFDDGNTWDPDNRCNRHYDEYWHGRFMIVDSWCADLDITLDEQLITRSFDCSRYESVNLEFSHYLSTFFAIADVDVRVAGGSWENVARYESKSWGFKQMSLDVAGQDDVQVRWHYHNAMNDWFWGIDDVCISGVCPATIPGDINLDCVLDMVDITSLANRWMGSGCEANNGWCFGADLDQSGAIGLGDLAVMSDNWSDSSR